MQLETGIIFGLIAAVGAGWRAYKGYQGHLKKTPYEGFSWKKFLITVLPAVSLGFVAGATYSPLPALGTAEGLTMMLMFFTGGAGIGSLQGKLPFVKPKK